jgi:hypothetical protein
MVMAVGMTMATTVRVSSIYRLADRHRSRDWRHAGGDQCGGRRVLQYRRRNLSVSLMSIGYPVGAVLGGIVAAQLLQGNNWRSVFYFGASVTALLIPIVYFVIPESVHWMARKQPAGALEKINAAHAAHGTRDGQRLPEIPAAVRTRSIAEIFQPGLVAITTIVTLAYFFHITTFYFIVKWIPEDRCRPRVPAVERCGRAGLDQCRRRHGRRRVRAAHAAVRVEASDDRAAGAVDGHGDALRPQSSRSRAVVDHLRDGGLLHQRRHRRSLRDHCAGVPDAGPCLRHRVHGGCRTRRVVLAPIIAGFLFTYGYSLPTSR